MSHQDQEATKGAYQARREIVAARPDPSDIDAWPDLSALPGRLLGVVELLAAEVAVARQRDLPDAHLTAMLQVARDAREALIRVNGMSPLEAWRLLHPPKYDALDGLYDCGGEDCPRTGYGSKENRDLHHRRWGKGGEPS